MDMSMDSGILNTDTSANFVQEPVGHIGTSDEQHYEEEWVEEIVEEQIHGRILLGNDGNFYIKLEEGTDDRNIDLEGIDTIKILMDDNGKQKLLFENSKQRDKLIYEKAHSKIEKAIRRKGEKEVKSQVVDEQIGEYSNYKFNNTDAGEEVVVQEEIEYDGYADVSDFYVPSRRQRVYGHCRCKECGQSFANMARLERHLSVHQQYGSYLCPLCGKTYKYEYNLFYHWRRTCRDMNELLSFDERKMIEINALRQLIEEIAQKKASIGPLELNAISSIERGRQQNRNERDWTVSEGEIFGDDLMEEMREGTLVIADDGKLVNGRRQQKQQTAAIANATIISGEMEQIGRNNLDNDQQFSSEKQLNWIQYGQSVQCSECFRSFSTVQRLEKHMIGAHYSFGTHHCLFCGGRFKYEYNLLYHYRHVCKYSLELLSKEERQQMEAANLKKAIRQIAAKREHPLSSSNQNNAAMGDWMDGGGDQQMPLTMDEDSISMKMEMKTELGDSLVRRQMMDKIIQRYGPSSSKSNPTNQGSASKQNILLPSVLLQPTFRPNLPDATPCPICSVTFYGVKVLARHLKAAHPNESTIWENTLRALNSGNGGTGKASASTENAPKLRPSQLGTKRKLKIPEAEMDASHQMDEKDEEQPPRLEVEDNGPREQFQMDKTHFPNPTMPPTAIASNSPLDGIRRRSTRTTKN